MTSGELEQLSQLHARFARLPAHDQHMLTHKLCAHVLSIYKNLGTATTTTTTTTAAPTEPASSSTHNILPKLQYLQFVFDLMEASLNVFDLLVFAIRLLHVGPLIEQFFRTKFHASTTPPTSKIVYFEYVSLFYVNVVGVLRAHLLSLCMWKELAAEAFKCLHKVVRNVERPSKCSLHEKCTLMLLNEMYTACGASVKGTSWGVAFEPLAAKIKAEKCFTVAPGLDKLASLTGNSSNSSNNHMKHDELLTAMILTTNHTVEEIETYILKSGCYYNFVAHVFVSISNLNRDEMLRVANLCAELTSRHVVLVTYLQYAIKALHRNTEANKDKLFVELPSKINLSNARCKENFKLFLGMLAARHCVILNEFIITVVKTCVMACPNISNDISQNSATLEPVASLACHVLQYLFTSAPRPLVYRRTTPEQRLLTASLRNICFSTFLIVLKCLFLLSK
jgi:hypothetical protein